MSHFLRENGHSGLSIVNESEMGEKKHRENDEPERE